PMMMVLPMVTCLKYFRSLGRYQGNLLSMPITRFCARATIRANSMWVPSDRKRTGTDCAGCDQPGHPACEYTAVSCDRGPFFTLPVVEPAPPCPYTPADQ